MKKPQVNVRLTFDEAYSIWREGKSPLSLNVADILSAMSARKKIAHAIGATAKWKA